MDETTIDADGMQTQDGDEGAYAENGGEDGGFDLMGGTQAQPERPGEQGERGKSAAEESPSFRMPDGLDNLTYDESAAGEFAAFAGQLGLRQEQTQKLFAFGAKLMNRKIGDGMEAVRAQIEGIKRKWEGETRADGPLMGDIRYANGLVDRFGTDETRKMFDETGVGSHKEMVRFLVEVGRAIGESPVYAQEAGGAGGGGRSDMQALANDLYKNMM